MIYADSGIIMRWIEGSATVRNPIELRWRQLSPSNQLFITSRISRLECRCKPLRDNRTDLLDQYEIFFESKELEMREIDAAVIEKATGLRAVQGLKTPDSIHAATAMLAGVAELWTTDVRFTKCAGLKVEVFAAV